MTYEAIRQIPQSERPRKFWAWLDEQITYLESIDRSEIGEADLRTLRGVKEHAEFYGAAIPDPLNPDRSTLPATESGASGPENSQADEVGPCSQNVSPNQGLQVTGEAVEAVARRISDRVVYGWRVMSEVERDEFRATARADLEAALPHLQSRSPQPLTGGPDFKAAYLRCAAAIEHHRREYRDHDYEISPTDVEVWNAEDEAEQDLAEQLSPEEAMTLAEQFAAALSSQIQGDGK